MRAPQSIDELDELASKPNSSVRDALLGIRGDVLVAGAGGKMGFHLCRMVRRGLDEVGAPGKVFAVSRFSDPAIQEKFESAGIATISSDLTKKENLEKLPNATALFFLAGIKFGTRDAPETLKLFNETMPALVAERFAGVPTVALSTGCVYPFVKPETGGCSESDSPDPPGAYALSCLGRENAFIESSATHGTPLSLIRLNYSVDLRYGVLVDLATKVMREEPVHVGMGYFNCIWQGDAIRYTVSAINHVHDALEPFILNVTGEKILKVRSVAGRFADQFGKSVSIQGTETESAWLNDASKSHGIFGKPEIEEDILIDWVADWIENERPLLNKPTHFEVRDGNY